jgi:uncharacterized membrane protein
LFPRHLTALDIHKVVNRCGRGGRFLLAQVRSVLTALVRARVLCLDFLVVGGCGSLLFLWFLDQFGDTSPIIRELSFKA